MRGGPSLKGKGGLVGFRKESTNRLALGGRGILPVQWPNV